MKKPPLHYMATLPDGTIPSSTDAGTPINLADHIGQLIDHPNPCKNKWYDETAFSYFRTYIRVGEVLQDVRQWPARLFVVEPVGETGNWAPDSYPFWVLAHRLRVVEETAAWQALGPRGREVEKLLLVELPGLARQWARDYAADPDGMRRRIEDWRLANDDHRASGMRARQQAIYIASRAHRGAAASVMRLVAINKAEREALATGAGQQAAHYAASRADDLLHAVLLEDKLRDYVLNALRGTDLDTSTARPTVA